MPIRLLDRRIFLGQRQRGHPVERFARDAESFPARGEHTEVRARREQVPTEVRRRADDLFAVVEDEQDSLGADVLGHRSNQRCPGDPGDCETLRDLVDEYVSIANGRKFGDAKTIGEVTEEFFGDAHRQPRLAGTSCARQRHQSMLVEQIHHVAQFAGATDETRQLRREVIVRTLDGSQTRKLPSERRVADLMDSHWFAEPSEAVRSEVDEFGTSRQSPCEQIDGRL